MGELPSGSSMGQEYGQPGVMGRYMEEHPRIRRMAVRFTAGVLAVGAVLGVYKLGEDSGMQDALHRQDEISAAGRTSEMASYQQTIGAVKEALKDAMPPKEIRELNERLGMIEQRANAFAAQKNIPERMDALSEKTGVDVFSLMAIMALTKDKEGNGDVFTMQRATKIATALSAENKKTRSIRGDSDGEGLIDRKQLGEDAIHALSDLLDQDLILDINRNNGIGELKFWNNSLTGGVDDRGDYQAIEETNKLVSNRLPYTAGYKITTNEDGSVAVTMQSEITPSAIAAAINGSVAGRGTEDLTGDAACKFNLPSGCGG